MEDEKKEVLKAMVDLMINEVISEISSELVEIPGMEKVEFPQELKTDFARHIVIWSEAYEKEGGTIDVNTVDQSENYRLVRALAVFAAISLSEEVEEEGILGEIDIDSESDDFILVVEALKDYFRRTTTEDEGVSKFKDLISNIDFSSEP